MEASDRSFVARIIRWDGVTLVNICDKELLGTTVKGKGIEMNISYEYFNGELVNAQQALDLVRSSNIANLVGERIVNKVLEANLASERAVKRIGSVCFLMVFKFTCR
ncbi:MAG: DUF424 family protein [Nitrososphaerota archaeon]|nr:DUF424 family protein [Nitrososphaerales archaeon]MCX8191980.1 DUF424 family protein [Nitrososphaerales archaeon]MDW8044727.1 DUF424 family protein [Nitrososphaerota archaeon]